MGRRGAGPRRQLRPTAAPMSLTTLLCSSSRLRGLCARPLSLSPRSTSPAATKSPTPKHAASPSSSTSLRCGSAPRRTKRGGRMARTQESGRKPSGQNCPSEGSRHRVAASNLPTCTPPGPDSRPFRPGPPHRFEVRSTSLLLKFAICGAECRGRQCVLDSAARHDGWGA